MNGPPVTDSTNTAPEGVAEYKRPHAQLTAAELGIVVAGIKRSGCAVRGRSPAFRSTAGRRTRRVSDRRRPTAATADHAPPPSKSWRAPGAAAGAAVE